MAAISPHGAPVDQRVEALVNDVIGQSADKLTLIVLEVLAAQGKMRFTALGHQVPGISQKMLTQTLRATERDGLERDGLVIRTIHPVIPPKVEYRLTDLGLSLGDAFCGVWRWAEQNLARIESARRTFDTKS